MSKKRLSPEQKQFRDELIRTLKEKHKAPKLRLAKIIGVCGIDFCRDILAQTQEIEAQGGMLTEKGDRRRTIGGVFFRLAKEQMTQEQWFEVVPRKKWPDKRPKVTPIDWSRRVEFISTLEQDGRIEDMRVTLMGYPGDTHRDGDVVITQMTHELHTLSLARQLPNLPERTRYTVYMPANRWEKVAPELEQGDKMLHIYGEAFIDPDIKGIAVLASTVEAKNPPKQKKSEPKPKDKPKKKTEKQPAPPTPPPIDDLPIPDDLPENVRARVDALQEAIRQQREKITELEQDPQKNKFSLNLARKRLATIEKELRDLLTR